MIPGSGRSPGEGIGYPLQYSWASLAAQKVKNPPAMWETWVRSLSRADPLEEGMATHSSILAWRITWTEEPGRLQFMGLRITNAKYIFCFPGSSAGKESACNEGDLGLIPALGRSPGEGNSYPLQYSGLENSMEYSPLGFKEWDMAERLSLLHYSSQSFNKR